VEKAQHYNLIPRITKKKVEENIKEIERLTYQLYNMQRGNEVHQMKVLCIGKEEADKVVEIKKMLTTARRQRKRLNSQLVAVETNMGLNNESNFSEMYSSSNTTYIKEGMINTSFRAFAEFFPDANIKKIEQIEDFHKQLQVVLHTEFEKARFEYSSLVKIADEEIAQLERKIVETGVPAKMSKVSLEKYSETTSKIQALERENKANEDLSKLNEEIKSITKQLKTRFSEKLTLIQSNINSKMDEINNFIYDSKTIPPIITLKDSGKSYTFVTPKDNGTGIQYKGLIVFDLSILELTPLPLLVHDSVLFNNISHEALEKIFECYSKSKKQIFVSIDKESSYTPKMRKILKFTTVLELSDNGNQLFGRSWNVKADDSNQTTETTGENYEIE
jgi:hypothetical protein